MAKEATRPARSSGSDRRERIAQQVAEQGFSTVTELAERFDVSEMTIRRDIARLVDVGRVRAFHGGVGSMSPLDALGVDYRARNESNSEAKRLIAQRAARLVESGDVIAIDAGTTAAHLAGLLPDEQLTVITPSLPVVTALTSHRRLELICLGGTLHPESLSFAGPTTLAAISNLHIGTLFLAASGLNERGAFCGNGFDAITKRALIDVSDRVILITDSSKFSSSAMVRTCGWDAIDQLIIDDGVDARDSERVRSAGVDVDVVPLARTPEGG